VDNTDDTSELVAEFFGLKKGRQKKEKLMSGGVSNLAQPCLLGFVCEEGLNSHICHVRKPNVLVAW